MNEYHILNGDALRRQFPEIEGEKIVIRECLIEGNAKGKNLEEIFRSRIPFFQKAYGVSEKGYREKSAAEINKMTKIGKDDIVNLWFENDLFCQINFWFSVNVLLQAKAPRQLYLVSPIKDSWRGFGALSREELTDSYRNRKKLNLEEQEWIGRLWLAYQASDWNALRKVSKKLNGKIDHIEEVVEAHIARFPTTEKYGRPQERILEIIDELEKPSFPKVFQKFCQTEGVYGFGDAQVKRMMEEISR